MAIQISFSTWPAWLRSLAAAVCLCGFAAVFSLVEGCGGVSSTAAVEPDFYISQLQDPHAVWLKSGANNPAPLSIPLPVGTSLNDMAALEYTGPSVWLYLVSATGNALVMVNQVGSNYQVAATVPVGTRPFALAIDGSASFAYVSNSNDSVTVVDLNLNQAVSTIALPSGSQPRGIAVTPDGKTVYTANQSTGTLSIIDAVARTVTGSIPVGKQPNRMAMSPNGKALYVSNSGDGTVSAIDVLSNSVSATLNGFTNTLAVGVNGAGGNLFAGQAPALSGPGSVAIYDTSTLTVFNSPVVTTAVPAFILGIGSESFLSVDQFTSKVTEQWVSIGNPILNKVWTVGVQPSAVAVLRQVNRSPSSPQNVTLTVATNPAGLNASIDSGAFSPAPISQQVPVNTTHIVSVTTPQFVAATGTGYNNPVWTPTGALAASTSLLVPSNTTATATFAPACYALTVNVAPVGSGSVSVNPATGGLTGLPANCYAPGAVVTLTAAGANGNALQSWTGATGAGNTATVTMNGATTVTANFAQPQSITLTVATNPTGLLARIGTSGSYLAAPISQLEPANQIDTISVTTPQFVAASGAGYNFNNWSTGSSSATTTVQPASNLTATANFVVACYTLTVNVAPTGSGVVSVNPATGGLTGLPSNCYAPGAAVTLTAAGANGNALQSWTGATGTGNTATVTVNGATTVTANFAQPPVLTIFYQSRPSGGANLSMGVKNTGGTTATNVTVTAISNITSATATFVYNPGLLVIPFVIPGAASLAPGANSGFNLNFTATQGSAGASFSFDITAQASPGVAPFTTHIVVP